MKKEYEETIKRKYFIVTCDFCEEEKRDSHFRQCCICGKDVCPKHTSYFYDDQSGSDYASHISCPYHKEMVQRTYDEYNEIINDFDMPDIDNMINNVKGKSK